MSLWLVALPGFLIMSSMSAIVNDICLEVPATSCLHILDSLRAILIVQWAPSCPDYKM